MFVEQKSYDIEIDGSSVEVIQDVLRSLPYEDLKISVEPKEDANLEISFYMGDNLLSSETISLREIKSYTISGTHTPNNPNANWVDRENGVSLGPRAKVIIDNQTAEPLVCHVVFSAKVESAITF
jgi:hypothetical protein